MEKNDGFRRQLIETARDREFIQLFRLHKAKITDGYKEIDGLKIEDYNAFSD